MDSSSFNIFLYSLSSYSEIAFANPETVVAFDLNFGYLSRSSYNSDTVSFFNSSLLMSILNVGNFYLKPSDDT